MICYAFVFRKIQEFGLLDLEPVLGSALGSVAKFLFRSHVRPTDPVFVLCLTFQVLQCVAIHLPRNGPEAPMLSDPLLPRDAFLQQGQGEIHGSELVLKQHITMTKDESNVSGKMCLQRFRNSFSFP